MDKAVHTLLAIGIAVLFPVLVLFAVMTAVPNEVKNRTPPLPPEYPTAPNCSVNQVDYNYFPTSGGNPTTNPTTVPTTSINTICQQRTDEYNRKVAEYEQKNKQYEQQLRQYDEQLKKDNKYIANRASIALAIAVVAILLTIPIRDIKELTAGIVAGSTLTIIGAVSWLFTYMGSTNIEVLPVVLITVSFAVLTAVLFALEKYIPPPPLNTDVNQVPTPPPNHPLSSSTPPGINTTPPVSGVPNPPTTP